MIIGFRTIKNKTKFDSRQKYHRFCCCCCRLFPVDESMVQHKHETTEPLLRWRTLGKITRHFHTTQRVGIPSPHRWPPMMGTQGSPSTDSWVGGCTILP